MKLRIGSAQTSAMTRGRISTSTGSRPMVESASISSRIFTAELAQHQNADHVDDIGIGAEFAEMENALLRDDGADQEGDQHHNRYRLPADPVELIDQRCQPQRSRPAQHAKDGRKKRATPLQEHGEVL